MSEPTFRPTLQYHFLTPLYDLVLFISGLGPHFKKQITQVANLPPKASGTILDIGCGTGIHAENLATTYPDMKIVALDPDQGLIARSSINNNLPNLSFVAGFAEKLPFQADSVDYAFSTLTFHHLELPQKVVALKEIYRVLKPGGTFVLTDWGALRFPLMKQYLNLIEDRVCIESHFNGQLEAEIMQAGFVKSRSTKVKPSGIWTTLFVKGD